MAQHSQKKSPHTPPPTRHQASGRLRSQASATTPATSRKAMRARPPARRCQTASNAAGTKRPRSSSALVLFCCCLWRVFWDWIERRVEEGGLRVEGGQGMVTTSKLPRRKRAGTLGLHTSPGAGGASRAPRWPCGSSAAATAASRPASCQRCCCCSARVFCDVVWVRRRRCRQKGAQLGTLLGCLSLRSSPPKYVPPATNTANNASATSPLLSHHQNTGRCSASASQKQKTVLSGSKRRPGLRWRSARHDSMRVMRPSLLLFPSFVCVH